MSRRLTFLTENGNPIPGSGQGNQGFYRIGAYGHWYVNKFDFYTFYMHGQDNVFLGNAVPSNHPESLSPGAVGPTWTADLWRGTSIPHTSTDRIWDGMS